TNPKRKGILSGVTRSALAVSVKDHDLIVANSNGEVIDAPPEIPVYYRIQARVSPGSKIINQLMAIRTPGRIIVILGNDNCTMRKELFARWVRLAGELPGIDLTVPAGDPEEDEQPVEPELICTGPIGKVWRDNKGREIFVSKFAGHQSYGTFYRNSSGGLHRVDYSNRMPMVGSAEQAQANLDAWARENKLEEVSIQ
ncbi:MAG: hypothetical protein RDU41_09725, partial [Clostridia bacterium]|nr:hypothetical protein [Clostridia bacterium]